MILSYNASIPNIGDFTAISQKQILANFQSINTTFFIDHVALTAVENVGKHNTLTLIPQSIHPITTNQSAIYNKVISGLPQLFFRPSANQTPIQLSNSNLNTVQTGAPSSTQSSFLAGPFTIYMGYIVNCPVSQLITLTPASTLIYVGLSTNKKNPTPVASQSLRNAVATNINLNQFTIVRPAASLVNPDVYYMAIGI